MKTKNKLTMLAFTALLSTRAIAADSAAIDAAILQMMTNGTIVGNTGVDRIDAGMDDDQIVGGDGADFVKPSTTNFSFGASQTGTFLTSVQYPYKVAAPAAPSMSTDGGGWTLLNANNSTTGAYTSSQGPYQLQGTQTNGNYTSVQYPYTLIAGGNGNDTFSPPVNRGLTSDTLSICGGNGNDSIIVGGVGIDYVCSAGTTGITSAVPGTHSFYADSTGAFPLTSPLNGAAPNYTNSAGALPPAVSANQIIAGAGAGGTPHINGDEGADTFIDRQILQLMTTGSLHGNDGDDTIYGEGGADSLWGDNGTDSLWLGGGTDELIYGETGSDSLYGGNGADTIKRATVTNSFVFGTTTR